MIALSATLTILVLWSAPADAVSESKLAERKTLGETSATCPDKWLDASFVEMGCLFFNNTAAVDWEEAKTGKFQVWYDGKKMIDEANVATTMKADERPFVMRAGLYATDWHNHHNHMKG